ncbi:MAG: sodium ion-translocating decarboxylase subunit beta [Phycisphaera sp.]|nr:sodium ion-translocating decarboxylase subunit beta [Phycisphaera sp.]
MQSLLNTLVTYYQTSGFGQWEWGNLVMICIGLLFIYLAVRRGFEPLLLVPIGFGMIVGNIPYLTSQMSIGVYDGPPDPAYTQKVWLPETVLVRMDGGEPYYVRLPAKDFFPSDKLEIQPDGSFPPPYTFTDAVHGHAFPGNAKRSLPVYQPKDTKTFAQKPYAYRFTPEEKVDMRSDSLHLGDVVVVRLPQGRICLADMRNYSYTDDDGNPVAVTDDAQLAAHLKKDSPSFSLIIRKADMNPWNAGVFWFLYRGVKWGFYPALIFLGIGAMTDFSCLLGNPKLFLLGAAAQVGIFAALFLALLLGFTPEQAASIGIIGGADGPTAIFVTARLAPDMLGAIALAAYSYMALVPIIQPPVMKLLTTKQERLIRMNPPKKVSKNVKVMFPLVGFLLTAFIAPGGLALLAMLFFGNLLKETMVTERLAKTARTAMIDIVTILLGMTVGATTTASNFLTWQTLGVFVLGATAFAVATAGGVLFGKIMNWVSEEPINPLIGAAGVSAVPMAARVVQVVANKEDPQNYLLEQAMGPNVAGVIGSAVAAGVLLSKLALVS